MPDSHQEEASPSDHSEFPSERPTLTEPIDAEVVPRGPRAPKDRALLTVLTGPEKGAVHRVPRTHEIVTIGRSDDATIRIPDQGLSRIHARLERIGDEFLLSDAGSTNGTFLDEVPVHAPVRIGAGARIRLGRRTLLSLSLHDSLEEEAALSVHEAALRDRLTGVYNRGVFDDRLAAELAFARRHQTPLSVILFDIDHFKSFNDQHGHQAGDAVLIAVGRQVQRAVRTEDVVARYGGEEFSIIARSTPKDRALMMGERIRAAVALTEVAVGRTVLTVTASVGVATFGSGDAGVGDAKALVGRADRALYAAKKQGRNRVVHVQDLGD